jgi:hypothetical protein
MGLGGVTAAAAGLGLMGKMPSRPLSSFLRSLYTLVSDDRNSEVVSWAADGTTFTIVSRARERPRLGGQGCALSVAPANVSRAWGQLSHLDASMHGMPRSRAVGATCVPSLFVFISCVEVSP